MLRKPSGPAKTFYFIQKIPIPPYLLAIAVGELVSREIGPISRVWSEPSMVDAGAFEFSETAKYLEAGGFFVNESLLESSLHHLGG